MATETTGGAVTEIRHIRYKLRRFWKLPDSLRLATPAFSGIFLLTVVCFGMTLASWAMVRLLPNMELIASMAKELPDGILALIKRLPELIANTSPSTEVITGALVSQGAYIITYAFGGATIFCFLLLLVAFVRRW